MPHGRNAPAKTVETAVKTQFLKKKDKQTNNFPVTISIKKERLLKDS